MPTTPCARTQLLSATMPMSVQRLARSAVLDPITVRVGMGANRAGRVARTVEQQVQVVQPYQKTVRCRSDGATGP